MFIEEAKNMRRIFIPVVILLFISQAGLVYGECTAQITCGDYTQGKGKGGTTVASADTLNSCLQKLMECFVDKKDKLEFLNANIAKINDLRDIDQAFLQTYFSQIRSFAITFDASFSTAGAIKFEAPTLSGPFGKIDITTFPKTAYSLEVVDNGRNIVIKKGGVQQTKIIQDGSMNDISMDSSGVLVISCNGKDCKPVTLIGKGSYLLIRDERHYYIEIMDGGGSVFMGYGNKGDEYFSSCGTSGCYNVKIKYYINKGDGNAKLISIVSGQIRRFHPARRILLADNAMFCSYEPFRACVKGRIALNYPQPMQDYSTVKFSANPPTNGDYMGIGGPCEAYKVICRKDETDPSDERCWTRTMWRGVGSNPTFRYDSTGTEHATGLFEMNAYDEWGTYFGGVDTAKYKNSIKNPELVSAVITPATQHPTCIFCGDWKGGTVIVDSREPPETTFADIKVYDLKNKREVILATAITTGSPGKIRFDKKASGEIDAQTFIHVHGGGGGPCIYPAIGRDLIGYDFSYYICDNCDNIEGDCDNDCIIKRWSCKSFVGVEY